MNISDQHGTKMKCLRSLFIAEIWHFKKKLKKNCVKLAISLTFIQLADVQKY